jgi:putative membrane protein
MKTVVRVAWVVGLGAVIVLIAHEGARSILSLLSQAGWRLFLLVPLHALPLLLDVFGWRALILARSRLRDLFLIASIREAINRLLPVANVGGEIVGIRLLARHGIPGPMAAASVIVEVLLTLVTQYLFVAIGVVCLLQLTDSVRLTGRLVLSLGAALPMLALLIGLLRNGAIFGRIERLAARLLKPIAQGMKEVGRGIQLDAAVREILTAHGSVARALGWQLAGLIAGCAETWLVLRWLGHPVGFAAALVLESLSQAARHFIFMVPAGLGVQEAGLMALGHVLGLGQDVAIALSLAKRTREILFGLPALAAWQWLEGGGGLLRARSRVGPRPSRTRKLTVRE